MSLWSLLGKVKEGGEVSQSAELLPSAKKISIDPDLVLGRVSSRFSLSEAPLRSFDPPTPDHAV